MDDSNTVSVSDLPVDLSNNEEKTDSDVCSQLNLLWKCSPVLVSSADLQALTPNRNTNNFVKGCKWSPDGSCLATNSDDRVLRIFNLPQQFCSSPIVVSDRIDNLECALNMRESELIYDYCWYPKMNSSEPSTCLIGTTSSDNPIHMWDAYNGRLVCTYRAYNYADEVIPALSLGFNSDGTKIYCGFEKSIRIFDTAMPGRKCDLRQTSGQTGLISCICVSCANPSIYATGSYDKSIGLYDEHSGNNICVLVGQKGGLTHLKFSSDGNRLYSGGRKDSEILCWDIRNLGQILQVINRDVTTNQRIYFDLTPDNGYLATGNDNGKLSIYDISSEEMSDHALLPTNSIDAHKDCVNGVSFHPSLSLLATTSGQRKFVDIHESDNDTSDDDQQIEHFFQYNNVIFDNTLKLWWFCSNLVEPVENNI